LQEQLVLSDDEESDEEGEDEACGGASKEEMYDDGKLNFLCKLEKYSTIRLLILRFNSTDARNIHE
jgi:hypothetical protein